ncbi:MAG: metallophosphoesterase [Lentisphaeria bacterium]|nr:metallophosphoesterase [Lentisphaeria bacterium]
MLLRKLLPVLLAGLVVGNGLAAAENQDKNASLRSAEPAYQVTVLGDVHYDGPEFHVKPQHGNRAKERKRNFAMWKKNSPDLLKTAADQTAKSSAFVVQLGDLTQGDCDTIELQENLFKKAFAAIKTYFPDLPVLIVKGNHDVRCIKQNNPAPAKNALLPLVAAELGEKELADGNYAFLKGKDLYISLDGFIGAPKIVAFLKKTLEKHPETRYVFVMTHLPVLAASVGRPFWRLPGSDKVLAMVENRRCVILAGHTHIWSFIERRTEHGRVAQLITTSMGISWTPGHELKKTMDWQQYADAVRARNGKSAEGQKVIKSFDAMAAAGQYDFSLYGGKSGFTVLDINDSRVEAKIYTDNSGTPALTLTLVENR